MFACVRLGQLGDQLHRAMSCKNIAVATCGIGALGFAVKTGLLAHEIFSGCPDTPFFTSSTACDLPIAEALYSATGTIITCTLTALVALSSRSQEPDSGSHFMSQEELNALVGAIEKGAPKAPTLPTQPRPRRLTPSSANTRND